MLQARKQLPSPPQAWRAGEYFFVYYLFSILTIHIHHLFFSEKQLASHPTVHKLGGLEKIITQQIDNCGRCNNK